MARTFHHGNKAKERHFGADWRWQATPSWWIRAMMTRPQRQEVRRLVKRTMELADYEDAPTAGGTPVKYTRRFLDYRAVQQTLVPYHVVLIEDGKQTQETHILTITYGAKLDESIFKNPEA